MFCYTGYLKGEVDDIYLFTVSHEKLTGVKLEAIKRAKQVWTHLQTEKIGAWRHSQDDSWLEIDFNRKRLIGDSIYDKVTVILKWCNQKKS